MSKISPFYPSLENKRETHKSMREMNKRRIGPTEFSCEAHPIFSSYTPPPPIPKRIKISHLSITIEQIKLGQEQCIICMQDICIQPVTLLLCSHSFCFGCIQKWFGISHTCPICKSTDERYIKYKYNYKRIREGLYLYNHSDKDNNTIDKSLLQRAVTKHLQYFHNISET